MLVSVVTPLNDDYELYDNAKCLMESGTEGGHVLVRLGNDETLGRELRTYLQTEKYVRHKNDGTLPESSSASSGFSEDNQERRDRLVTLLGRMLAEADTTRRASRSSSGRPARWRPWTRPWSTSSRTRSRRWAT